MAANPPPTPEAERLTDEEVADRAREVGITSRKLLALEVQAHRAFWARVEAGDEALVEAVAAALYAAHYPKTATWADANREAARRNDNIGLAWITHVAVYREMARAALKAASEAQS